MRARTSEGSRTRARTRCVLCSLLLRKTVRHAEHFAQVHACLNQLVKRHSHVTPRRSGPKCGERRCSHLPFLCSRLARRPLTLFAEGIETLRRECERPEKWSPSPADANANACPSSSCARVRAGSGAGQPIETARFRGECGRFVARRRRPNAHSAKSCWAARRATGLRASKYDLGPAQWAPHVDFSLSNAPSRTWTWTRYGAEARMRGISSIKHVQPKFLFLPWQRERLWQRPKKG